MGCDSWVFVHKHISDAEDGNGRVIERKVLWNYGSWEIGEMFVNSYDLGNGHYRSTCAEDLIVFADECLSELDANKNTYEYAAFKEMKELLEDPDERANYFVSVDW